MGDILIGMFDLLFMVMIVFSFICLIQERSKIFCVSIFLLFVSFNGIFFTSFASNTYDIKSIKIFTDGRLEVSGENVFKDTDTFQLNYGDYKIKKSKDNKLDAIDKTYDINLTNKYYDMYKKTIDNEESVEFKIE